MEQHSKPRVGVLYGGVSAERQVSLATGKAVGEALASIGYPVEMLDILEVPIGELTPERMDVAFIALHGTFGEDGGIQSVLEVQGVPYTGSGPRASRLAMDKVASKRCFAEAGVPTPPYVEIGVQWDEGRKLAAAARIGFPLIVKPASQGSSVGVTLVRKPRDLPAALGRALEFDDRALLEKFIPGRELTVGILHDHPLPIIELVFEGNVFTYDTKYRKGAAKHVVNPDLPPGVAQRVEQVALAAHHSLGCRGCTRVDLRLSTTGEPYVLEVNTIPGMTGTSLLPEAAQAVGIGFPELCELAIRMALEAASRGAVAAR